MSYVPVTYDPQDATGRATGVRFHLLLPQHTVHQKLAHDVARQNPDAQVMTLDDAVHRSVDQPLEGRVIIAARDEREVGDGPLMIYDHRPGHRPLLFVTSQTMPWQAAMEWMDEARYYGTEGDQGYLVPRPDVQGDFVNYIERRLDSQVGRKRFAFTRRDGLAGDWI